MKTIMSCFIYTSLIFSQGMYLSKESGFSLGLAYSGNRDLDKISFDASYSLLGLVDLSYARSKFLNENTNNFQNEYFIRAYILKDKLPIFFSGSLGYIYQKADTELWKNFTLSTTAKGFAYEMGLHLSAARGQKGPKIITSIIYRYFNSEEIIKTPTAAVSDKEIIHSLMFEAAIVYYFSHIGIIAGPRINLENSFKYVLLGFNVTFMFRY